VAIFFITGPEGSGTTALVRALTNHPAAAKGDVARYGRAAVHGASGAQVIPAEAMSTDRPGRFDLPDRAEAIRCLRNNSATLLASQPDARAIFFKYSTPALRSRVWPVFAPLFEASEFHAIVIWRAPLDTVYSAYRRFYQERSNRMLDVVAAALSYVRAVRHIRAQLRESPEGRCLVLRHERLVARPEAELRRLCAFAGLDYCPAEQLLPGRGFSDERGKWKETLRRTLTGGRA